MTQLITYILAMERVMQQQVQSEHGPNLETKIKSLKDKHFQNMHDWYVLVPCILNCLLGQTKSRDKLVNKPL